MKESVIVVYERPELKDPIFIEGLPGIGLVGKLAADHLIKELNAKKFAELYSPHFLHQVLVKKDSTVDLMKNEFYYWKGGEEYRDIIIITGDTQVPPTDSYGHFEVVGKMLDFVGEFGTKEIITMGGFQVPELQGEPKVLGSVTHVELKERYKDLPIIFREDEGGAIVGAAGLLLGIGKLRGMRGISLLGESLGYVVDAKAAKAVLSVVARILGIEIDMSALDERAKETEEILKKVQEMQRAMFEQQMPQPTGEEEDRGYL
ncbi:MAG: proteasome assembly chaperone family protein [Palaeococcus sp.]|uniref:proteasome assembly chaperone family protein n=1 Tax=Palaeococcus sp. (in: euryarchaeotes) TaxID=2820298 RepID=UPI0025E14B4E|nr:proteasome assembly chaperone family protein [Palaeococcus sp. (in: euryarchaeotes)]MCD6558450.1 proteasome assembly chaperone family protein [Palaeococcus sp. (in: euryarchaeotes)]